MGKKMGIAMLLAALILSMLTVFDNQLSNLALFLDAPSFAGFALLVLAIFVFTREVFNTAPSVKAAFSDEKDLSEQNLQDALHFFKLLSKTVIYSAFIIFFIGLYGGLHMLDNIDHLFAVIAISLLPVGYAAVFNLIFTNTAIHSLQKKLSKLPKSN